MVRQRIVSHLRMSLPLAAMLIAAGCVEGCPPLGGTLDIRGPSGGLVIVQVSSFARPCCRADQGCFEADEVFLPRTGVALLDHAVDGVDWIVIGRRTLCAGRAFLPCSGTVVLPCIFPVGLVAFGEIKIVGPGVECVPYSPGSIREICNNTWVKVSINGVTVSARAGPGTTAASLASTLATKINSHSTLNTMVLAVASGDTILVRAVEEGFEHTYPWDSSTLHIYPQFTYPAFEAKRAPIATLALE